ncbi:unnamed protein product [Macrosiphum euphorbiae]|uniref:BACK domain-containing protein n=1 Tax=Macrosiphum euphorbiae TaxID=13131 RepID=A0AAV0WZT0_9HEMI|nr:unnamed protein product [Macrosiphum euphorbiae]
MPKQFLAVMKYEFISLSHEEVIQLISCSDLTVPFEENVFESVINWLKHELGCRKQFLPELMEHVRLPLTSKAYESESIRQCSRRVSSKKPPTNYKTASF